MKYLAILTFDLIEADADDYKRLNEALSEKSFMEDINPQYAKGKLMLPNNVYSCEFEYDKIPEITCGELKSLIAGLFKDLGLRGKYFIQVSSDSAWEIGDV